MNILHSVQLYSPHMGGSEEVVRQISERLVKHGHHVTIATGFDRDRDFTNLHGVEVRQFQVSGNIVEGIHGTEQNEYVKYVLDGDFDVVMHYAAQTWSTDLLLPYLKDIQCSKVLVPCGYSGLHNPRYSSYFEALSGHLHDYDQIVYMSVNYQDKAFGDQHGITAYSIIPNGADEGEFSSPQIGFREKFGINTKYLLICVANFYRSKGQDLVVNVFKRLNRDDVTLILIGNPVQDRNIWRQRYYLEMRLKSMMSSNINILEDITREWVVSAYKEADIFVFGSQIECSPLVIQEAMAAGIPFVSTHCGDVSDYERFGDVVAGEDEMVERLNHLLDADELRSRMGTEAKNYWREHHTWDIIATQYEDMYKKLID